MDLIDGDLLDINFRVKNDESDFKRVLKKYETALPAPTPLDTTPLLETSAASPVSTLSDSDNRFQQRQRRDADICAAHPSLAPSHQARLYNEIKGFEPDAKEGEWWDRWLTFTPPAASKRREEQRQLTRQEQKALQEQQRNEAEARAQEIEEDLTGSGGEGGGGTMRQ